MAKAYPGGWLSLPDGAEVHLDHGIPDRVWVPDARTGAPPALLEALRAVTGYAVELGAWEPGQHAGTLEAAVRVAGADFEKVLRALAHASAETFYDRYRKAIDEGDVDFDDEAYAQDFDAALRLCGLHRGQIEQRAFHDLYVSALHAAAREIAHPG